MVLRGDEKKLVGALLLITTSTGMLDAVSLVRLKTFTAYMSGTIILLGIHFAERAALAGPGLVALAAFLLGAVGGGRLVRRRHPPPKLVGDVLIGVAALVGAAATLDGFMPMSANLGVIAVLGLAMGLQTSATRHAGVLDMTMPAATMILHGLAHDSHLAGGTADRAWRRVGVLTGLLAGAAAGAFLSGWRVWLGLAAPAVLILAAGMLLRRPSPAAEPCPQRGR